MGALFAISLGFHAPNRIARFVIAGAPPGVIRSAPFPLRMLSLPLVGSLMGRIMMANATRDASRGELLVAHPERLDEALLDADAAHTRRNYRAVVGLLRCALNARGVRRPLVLRDRWRALSLPTLFLCGERDSFMTPERVEAWRELAAHNPNVTIVEIPDAGHFAWIDEPERVVGEVERFLAG